jgi:hypothetical protein
MQFQIDNEKDLYISFSVSFEDTSSGFNDERGL